MSPPHFLPALYSTVFAITSHRYCCHRRLVRIRRATAATPRRQPPPTTLAAVSDVELLPSVRTTVGLSRCCIRSM